MEIMPPPDWPMGKLVIHFLDMEVSDHCGWSCPLGWYCPWVGIAPGLVVLDVNRNRLSEPGGASQ